MTAAHSDEIGELFRGRGMRSTPQRRAILGVFHGGRTEHLSADEVYVRAARQLPDLSRATVYATLAEFSELGLLSAVGSPEPVRYETETEPHAHLRCQSCMRIFDLPGVQQGPEEIDAPGFIVESVETRAEGICDECIEYEGGLEAGVKSILDAGSPIDGLSVSGVAVSGLESPLGRLLLAATPQGLIRVAFEDHHDAQALQAHETSRRGSKVAREHLSAARTHLTSYFSGDRSPQGCRVDWERLSPASDALQATQTIPYASHCSYSELGVGRSPRELGLAFGANPIPIITPCHRVSRGTEVPASYVGGTARRSWLAAHESAQS